MDRRSWKIWSQGVQVVVFASEDPPMNQARVMVNACCSLMLWTSVQPGMAQTSEDAAFVHHARGVRFHEKRCLDEASQEYAAALELDPPREPAAAQVRLVRRFLPRVYLTGREPFKLLDFAAIVHPTRRWIAYHFFWEDDIDFPEDNYPCDQELVWVEYAEDEKAIKSFVTYFHGRLLRGGKKALDDARAYEGRPRVNVQWGKHGSLPLGWENMEIVASEGDSEKSYYPLQRPITLLDYNRGTYEKLSKEGRRLPEHPLGRSWPKKFSGSWEEFTDFSKLVDLSMLLDSRRMIRVSRWNSATINQHFLRYNFRPKTEWPESR
jgi:hypothetical protein